jgi:cytochrome b561/polyisoprenoid-binding protein YceI
MPSPAAQRYTAVAIILHWLIALSIVSLIGVGWYMGDMAPGADQFAVIQLHKSFGITVLVLSVARVVWRLMNPPPPEPPMPGWQALASRLVHISFYVLIIAMPLTGWIMVSASPAGIGTKLFGVMEWPHIPGLSTLPHETKEQLHDPLEFVHSKLAWVIIVLLGLHVAGALKHQFIDRDGLLARMLPGLFGKAEPPAQQGRGGLFAAGAAAAVLALGAVLGLLGPGAPTSAQEPEQQNTASSAPFWDVDPAQSGIVFRGAYMGRPFEGRFAQWTATIQFDPAKPEDARIRVTIPTGSAATGEPYFDENMPEGDWFNVAQHPEAVFEVNEGVFKDSDTNYEATGVLTIKGVVYPLRLPFTLDIEGDTARMHAEIVVQRLGLGIGRDTLAAEDGDAEWVADDVSLVIDVVATRQ